MFKNFIKRFFIGGLGGIAVGIIITIIISYTVGDGNYYPVVPELADIMGNELNAMLLQFILLIVYGGGLAGISVIWEMEKWSLLRQTVTHLIICSLMVLPIAYGLRWMPHNVKGIVIYFVIFFATYAIIWICAYISAKKKIKQLNEKICKDNK